MKKALYLFLLFSFVLYADSEKEYLKEREQLILKSQQLSFDREIVLSASEKKVNLQIQAFKKEPLKKSLYQLIHKMPKGGLLHAHSTALLESKWLIEELSTLPNCYGYWEDQGSFLKGTFEFYEKGKAPKGFVLVAELKTKIPNLNAQLLSLLQMDKTSSNRWERFEDWFLRTQGLMHYKPAFKKYLFYAMESLVQDNLQYAELRVLNVPLHDLSGRLEKPEEVIKMYLEVKKKVREKHSFFDFKIIQSEYRNISLEESLKAL